MRAHAQGPVAIRASRPALARPKRRPSAARYPRKLVEAVPRIERRWTPCVKPPLNHRWLRNLRDGLGSKPVGATASFEFEAAVIGNVDLFVGTVDAEAVRAQGEKRRSWCEVPTS